mmetsp:Transcript_24516/g.37777  ORF Transcript_24516/g.37777 Transcript_24516/m.37777 type:complete len:250 (-) Transcript_24516:89-838(-)
MNRSNRSSSSSMNQSNRSSTSTRTAPLPEDGNKSILSSSTRSSGPRRVSFNHVIKKSFTVVTKEDNSIAGLNSRGIAYYQTGSYTKAAKLFEQAASECSKSLARALWETVQRRCSTKDSVPKSKSMYHNMNLEGYKFYKTVFSVSEQDNVQVMCNITLFNAAQAQRMLGEYERALKHYQLSYFVYPKSKSTTYNHCLHNVGQFFHCMVGPSDTSTLFKRCFGRGAEAWLLSREGSLKTAILDFQERDRF